MLHLARDAGPWFLLQLLATPVALLVCLACGVVLALGRRAPAVVPVASLAVVPVAGVLGSIWGLTSSLGAVAHASPEMQQTLVAAGIVQILANQVAPMWLVTGPSLLLLLLCAIAGARGTPWRRGLPATAAGLAVALAVAGLLSGVAAQDPLGGAMRGGLYLVAGLLCAASLLGREDASPHAGATAALALPVLIGCVEAGAVARGELEIFEAVAHVSSDLKRTYLLQGLGLVDAGRAWSWVALALSTVVAGLGVSGALRDRPGWNAGVLLGLLGAAAAALLLTTGAGTLMDHLAMEWR